MKYVPYLMLLIVLVSSCSRILNRGTGGNQKKNKTTKVPGQTSSEPVGEEKALVKQAGIRRYYLTVDGTNRTFIVQLPKGYSSAKAYPVVFFFHSIRGKDTSWIKARGVNSYIDKNDYIAVYGQGANGGYWNPGGNYPMKPVNDVKYVTAMFNWLQSNTKVDSKKVFAVGTSNGAILIHYLAVQTHIFTAVSTISGSLYTNEMNGSATPVAMLQFHGTADKTVAYDGGYNPWGYTFISAEETAKAWANVNGCGAKPTVTNMLNGKVKAYSYTGCSSGKPVVLYALPGVPHKVLQSFDADWIYNQIFEFFKKNS